MRGYMAYGEALTSEKELRFFLTMALRAYNVPQGKIKQALAFVSGLDIHTIAEQVMQQLSKYRQCAMNFRWPELKKQPRPT